MSTVGDVLRSKGRAVYSIDARRSVHDALGKMVDWNVAALVVTDEKSELAGIVSQRDVAKKVVLCDRAPKSVSVKEIMTLRAAVIKVVEEDRNNAESEHCSIVRTRIKRSWEIVGVCQGDWDVGTIDRHQASDFQH